MGGCPGRRPVFSAVGVARIERLQGVIDRPLGKEAAWRPRRAGLAEEQIVRRLRQQEAVPRRRSRYFAKPLHTHLIAPSDLTKQIERSLYLRFSTTPACDLVSSPGTLAATAQSARLEIVHGKNNLRERHHGKFRSPHIRAGGRCRRCRP